MSLKYRYILIAVALLISNSGVAQSVDSNNPPGVIINHIPSKAERFIGSPSISILPNGDYIASHDEFGSKSSEFKSAISRIYRSTDKGESWEGVSSIDGQFWSTLFFLEGNLYIMGTNKHHGNLILRKSSDGGNTWSIPYDAKNGLILEGEYHTAPVPVVVHAGRVWRAVEYATATTTRWGERYSALVVSAPVNSDIMDASNWTRSNHLGFDASYLNNNFRAWLEGNIVVGKDGSVFDMLRVHVPAAHEEYAAIVDVNENGETITFDSSNFVKMPGASKKFTIRYDDKTDRYWSIVNYVPEQFKETNPDKIRNYVALATSTDLKTWVLNTTLLSHPDNIKHGFQYIDWLFEGEDIIFVARTAYDEVGGQAKNNHDANYLTFHRIEEFRKYMKSTIE